MRTQEQIADKIRAMTTMGKDPIGFQTGVLMHYLGWPLITEFIRTDAALTEDQWRKDYQMSPEPNDVIQEMGKYMEFAWDKSMNHRGLSAGRSVEKMKAWLWMLNDDLADQLDDKYPPYGAPALYAICVKYSFQVPMDHRASRMIQGLRCSLECGTCLS